MHVKISARKRAVPTAVNICYDGMGGCGATTVPTGCLALQLCLPYDDNLTMTDLSHMMEAARLLGGGQVSHPHVEDLEAHVENNGSHVHVVATDLCSEAVICNGQEGIRTGMSLSIPHLRHGFRRHV